MALIHGLYLDLEPTKKEEKNDFARVDRPKGMERKIVGNAPDQSAGQIGLQNYAQQLNTQTEFEYSGEHAEKYNKVILPKVFLTKPLTLWLYCNGKDRDKFFTEMRLLVENFDNYFWTDLETINLQCWLIGFTKREVYYLVLKRFPKLIHKINPEYPFLGCEILRTKLTINDIKSDDDDRRRCLTSTYCRNLKMDGFHEYVNEFGNLHNKVACRNWAFASKQEHSSIKRIPMVNFSDPRLRFSDNFEGSEMERSKYFQFWRQNDTNFADTFDETKRGYNIKDINIGIRNFVDHSISKYAKEPEKSLKHYEKFGHGLRDGINTKVVQCEEDGKKVNRIILIPTNETKGPELAERSKNGNIQNKKKKKLSPTPDMFDQAEMDSIQSCAFVEEGSSLHIGKIEDSLMKSPVRKNPIFHEKKIEANKIWNSLISLVGETNEEEKNRLVIERENILLEIERQPEEKQLEYYTENLTEVQNQITFYKEYKRLPEPIKVPDQNDFTNLQRQQPNQQPLLENPENLEEQVLEEINNGSIGGTGTEGKVQNLEEEINEVLKNEKEKTILKQPVLTDEIMEQQRQQQRGSLPSINSEYDEVGSQRLTPNTRSRSARKRQADDSEIYGNSNKRFIEGEEVGKLQFDFTKVADSKSEAS